MPAGLARISKRFSIVVASVFKELRWSRAKARRPKYRDTIPIPRPRSDPATTGSDDLRALRALGPTCLTAGDAFVWFVWFVDKILPADRSRTDPAGHAPAHQSLTLAKPYVLVLFMIVPATSPEEIPPCACCASSRIARQLAMLQELAEIGMDLARAVRREALAEPKDGDQAPARSAADYDLALSRIARAVRQTLALETRLAADHQADQEAGRHIVRESARRLQTQLHRAQRRAQVREIAAEAIDAGIADDCRLEVLAEMDERLERYDDETRDDLERKPIGALVAEICRALGVDVDWSLWEHEEWACLEAVTKAPGSPYVHHRLAPQPPPDLATADAFAAPPGVEHPPP